MRRLDPFDVWVWALVISFMLGVGVLFGLMLKLALE